MTGNRKSMPAVLFIVLGCMLGMVIAFAVMMYLRVNDRMEEMSAYEDSAKLAAAARPEDAGTMTAEKLAESRVARNGRSASRKLKATAHDAAHLGSQAGNTYVAANLLDGNPATAWAVDLDTAPFDSDHLYGPTFTLDANRIDYVTIVNGYAKSVSAFKNNTSARYIKICRVMDGDEFPEPEDIIYSGSLRDTMSPQKLPVNPGFDNSRPTREIAIYFPADPVYYRQGAKWNDFCISEIEFWGN